MNILRMVGLLSALLLAACASASVLPMSADTLQISARAAPICGGAGAESIAFRRAAVETIRHNFDRFIILNAQALNNVKVVMAPPTQ